ncbi:maleylpyruvate isomerase family mycothiol-dependent enzyme [Luedemannella flava]|uniref:maleylpyruvate isomerase family mycothiol-dependent enzyme n=1 Tax=Luedemannella flava TaxID=349316 RepID=UPI0031D0D0CD
MSSTQPAIAAWRHSLDAVLDLGDQLTDEQWAGGTECPEWSVGDVYAHLIGTELWMIAGHPRPESYQTWSRRPVVARRDMPREEILDELRDVYAQRRAQLRAYPPDPGGPAVTAQGQSITMGFLLAVRAFDTWVHEQDIRRATGHRGNLDSPGAFVARDLFLGSLPRIVARDAKAEPGQVLRLTVTGPVEFDEAVVVDAARRGYLEAPVSAGQSTAHVTVGWESFARLACGRIEPRDADGTVTGDERFAARVLNHLVITP